MLGLLLSRLVMVWSLWLQKGEHKQSTGKLVVYTYLCYWSKQCLNQLKQLCWVYKSTLIFTHVMNKRGTRMFRQNRKGTYRYSLFPLFVFPEKQPDVRPNVFLLSCVIISLLFLYRLTVPSYIHTVLLMYEISLNYTYSIYTNLLSWKWNVLF